MKTILTILLLLSMSLGVRSEERSGVVLPGKGHVDLEQLNKPINLTQDVSQLNLGEVRILRNAFYARVGYPFKDAYLRGMFESTSWYDSLMYEFDANEANFRQLEEKEDEEWRDHYYRTISPTAVKLTPQEQAFIKKLQEREKELLAQNFTTKKGCVVNTDNIYNSMQLPDADPKLMDRLAQKGFAIIPAQHEQLFHVYEANDYINFPCFVTTDLFLQLYHLYFDCTLRDVEEHKFDSLLTLLCSRGSDAVAQRAREESNAQLKDAAEWLQAYFAVGAALQKGRPLAATGKYAKQAQEEIAKVEGCNNDFSTFLGYEKEMFAYGLFRPRGHYTRTEQLQRYFRTMMWLQTVPFGTDRPEQLQRALLLADIVGGNERLAAVYRQLTEPLTFLMGQPDNVDIMQVYQVMQQAGATPATLVKNSKQLAQVRQTIEQIAEKQTRIKPKYLMTSVYKINLMPQRYQPDAEVLQEMVDYDNEPPHRITPRGLDVFAAMGVSSAERILISELHEADRWSGFLPMMERMKRNMRETDWQETVAKQWMKSLTTVAQKDQKMPYFMLTQEWDKKNLNAMLASWAELKHDAILYAKQPMGAECGGGGPPDPVTKAYVEPNVTFWQKAVDLLNATETTLKRYGLFTEKAENATTALREEAELLCLLSQKELEGKRLKDEEYDQLAKIGSTFEYISLDLVREPDQDLMGWDDVQGPDRCVALVADVYTANAFNNQDHQCILYEAVGFADEIYVVVEIEGMLYLMRGAVLSYREFDRPLDIPRLTDEEWQEHLRSNPRDGVPQWMEEIIVPLETAPQPNEEYFYSSGC
jgi:hypothetical protein